MSNIVALSPQPDRPDPALPPIACTPWCMDGTGHSDATHPAEQRCRSYVHRLESRAGGGREADQTVTSYAALYLQVEQAPGERPVFTVGVELAGTEQWLQLNPAELRTLLGYAHLALDQAA